HVWDHLDQWYTRKEDIWGGGGGNKNKKVLKMITKLQSFGLILSKVNRLQHFEQWKNCARILNEIDYVFALTLTLLRYIINNAPLFYLCASDLTIDEVLLKICYDVTDKFVKNFIRKKYT
ncbi:hypothetical protein ACJX0J_012383, partial [Zea mays]